jgi:hypothetical protein
MQRKSSVILFAKALLSVKYKAAEYQEKRNKAYVTFPWKCGTNKLQFEDLPCTFAPVVYIL